MDWDVSGLGLLNNHDESQYLAIAIFPLRGSNFSLPRIRIQFTQTNCTIPYSFRHHSVIKQSSGSIYHGWNNRDTNHLRNTGMDGPWIFQGKQRLNLRQQIQNTLQIVVNRGGNGQQNRDCCICSHKGQQRVIVIKPRLTIVKPYVVILSVHLDRFR